MKIAKAQVLQLLRSRGDHDNAEQADKDLPGEVDTDQHGALLSKFGIDPKELLGGGLGGVAGKLSP